MHALNALDEACHLFARARDLNFCAKALVSDANAYLGTNELIRPAACHTEALRQVSEDVGPAPAQRQRRSCLPP